FKEELIREIEKYCETDSLELLEKLLNVISKNKTESKKKTETINLKPTKLSEKAISDISNNYINNSSIAFFYRSLFDSYASIPQNHRELIMFKDNYELILDSIKKNRKVCITLKNGEIIPDASIYTIEAAKEELYNYVLYTNKNNKPLTSRLNRIKYVSLSNGKREISDEATAIFQKQIKYGVQYPIYSMEEETVVIKLNQRGQILFKKIYLYRPIPDKIEGDLYYFNCSHNQIIHYFKRFGYDALIISPAFLTQKMKDYYFFASRKYDKLLFKNKDKINNY
ncbi:MAG: hypothetical protein K2N42_04080, partial [Anaeroplasmataceae bacterium]|nr:hypothetical protein [Anaeroplasmataceae bacterium]